MMASVEGQEHRFLADHTLGRLGRWLRIMGLDCADASESGDELIERALEEGRILLTRNRSLSRRRRLGPCLLLASDHLEQQLLQFLQHFSVDPLERALSRCVRCNRRLEPVGAGQPGERVPWHVRRSGFPISRCPACGRFYWPATHAGRMRLRLERLSRLSKSACTPHISPI